jgi:transcription antitermination factor NusG
MNWYAIQVRGRRGAERVAQTAVLEAGVWARVPLVGKTQDPILPGYVILPIDECEIGDVMRVLRSLPASSGYVIEVPSGMKLGGAVGLISDEEMQVIDLIERHGVASEVEILTPETLPPGREICITRGIFAGMRARLAKWEEISEEPGSPRPRKRWRMVVALPGMGRILTVQLKPEAAKAVHEAAANAKSKGVKEHG